ncbi:unnamed protein product [Trichogramma brassicae]|uniref:Reverse transcriptase domain-containing protein n=1 Tax=Trichogramma brassicae TaxID=86971 RepID=A0A6H5I597_9HYME|nr:unnamed protein product [Trichogramma brassicae]
MTEGYCHPIPLTVDILERLASANYISCIDLRSGFHQIAMDEGFSIQDRICWTRWAMATIEGVESRKIPTREQDDTGNDMPYDPPDDVRFEQQQDETSPVDQSYQQNYGRTKKSVDKQSENSLQLSEKRNEVTDRLSIIERSNDHDKETTKGLSRQRSRSK